MAKFRIMVLSDIHIGIDAMSNWYQRKVHQDLLIASLKWAQNDANCVHKLVLLGDLVDLWTYVPSLPPPTFELITDPSGINNAIFGANGELAKTVAALGKDNVVYVNGNHDMTVTADQIHSAISPDISVMPSNTPIYDITLGQRTVYMTHGHIYSLLCANDFVNPPASWNHLPLGYFITRMSALLSNIECKKKGVKNAAYLPNLGNPMGYDVPTILMNLLTMWHKREPFNLPDLVVDGLQPGAGEHRPVTEFVMPRYNDKEVIATADDVKKVYRNLFTGIKGDPNSTWSVGSKIDKKFYADLNNTAGAEIAFVDADALTNLTVWASLLELTIPSTKGKPIIVMGHTHKPKDDDFIIRYTNSGFNCPAKPDMDSGKAKPTFSIVEWDEKDSYRIYVNSIVPSGEVEEDEDPKII